MSFVVSVRPIPHGKKFGEIYIKGDEFHTEENNLLVFKESSFQPYTTSEEIFDQICKKGINETKKIKGEFAIVFYDDSSKEIYIANDKLGRENLFYYHNENNFILSDDFWEAVNIIDPEDSEIDVQSIKEFVIFHRPLFFKTIVKNLNFFPPASIGKFSIENSEFNLNSYWDFRFNSEAHLNISETAERLNRLLDDAVKRIKEKYDSGTVYGFGLSGGLDSRLIPPYASKHNMKLKSFIIGEKKPNKILISRDHLSARKIKNIYDFEHFEISQDCTDVEHKSYCQLKYAPMVESRLFDTVDKNKLPEFDVLLNGLSGGELLGQRIPNNIENLNEEGLVDTIMQSFSNIYETCELSRALRIKIFLSKLGLMKRPMVKERINKLISEKDFIKIRSKILDFVKTELAKKKTNIDIFQNYLFSQVVSNNKYAYFSMFWKKINYSIFTDPYLFEEYLKWNPKFLINRKLQRHFYINKFPSLAKISSQNNIPPIFYWNKSSRLRNFFTFVVNSLRGTGIDYDKWRKRKKYIKFARKTLMKQNKVFESVFDVEKILNNQLPPSENLIKIKQILDLIQSKEYKKFL